MNKRTIGVIGLGPVGSILATHLAKNGMDVIVEDIAKELLIKAKKDGLEVSGIKELTVRFDEAVGSLAELTKFDPEVIFIATKACFLRNVLTELKPLYKAKMKIVSFQNGLDNERLIAETLGINTAYRVVVNYAGNLVAPGKVRMNWFQPPNYIGAFKKGLYTTDETTKHISNILTASELKTEEAPNIKKQVWEKTILNSALCSVCALTGQTMKEAMEHEFTRSLTIRALDEGLTVARKDGYDFGENALNMFTSYLEKGGNHKPSMLVDVEHKTRTEVDFLSGAIAAYGRQYGIKTPVNDVLTSLIKGLESKHLKRQN